jgi:predicted ATPase/Tfp pilus assembly protein PilF
VEAGSLESRLVVACGAALGLNFATAQEPRVQLLNYLRHKNCLLIIDNFESILPAAPFLINILDSAPQITLLVTTRLPLNLQAEYLYRLPGMSVPAEALPQDIAAYDSLLLFQERAERAAGRPIPVDRELPHIVQICRSVEGLPLGIELAASWMRWHTPGEIVTLLQENLEAGDLVTQTPGDLPPRHHSLRTVFDHSWQLLQPEARRVLAQLSQFRGPFSAEAGLFVTQSTRAELAALVDSSLLQRSLEGYYQLHGLVRRFAAGKLVELDLDSLLLHERLMTYYMAFAGDLSPALNGENPRAALQRVQAELDNVLYAWQLATAAPHPSQLARGLSGMVDYWGIRGLFRQAQDALAQTLHRLQEAAPDATAELMARLLVEYAGMLFEVGNYDQAKQAAQQGIALAEQAHLAHVVPGAHLALGRAHWGQGQFENAREHLEHALQAVREAGDAALEAVILRNLAAVSWRGGNLSSARALCEEAQSLNRRLRNVRNESKDLLLLGIIADNEHRHDEAHATFERVLQLGQQSGDRRVIVSAYAEIGLTASHQGRLDRALHYLQMNLAMVRETGSFWHEGVTLSNLGDLRLKLGDFAGAESAYRGALDLARQANSLVLESNILSFWSLLDHFRECYDAGIDRARQSLQLAQQIDVPRETAFARQFLAHNLLASGDPEAAREHYQEARPIWLSLQDRARALESLTGLARVARARGDEAAVHEQVGALYNHLQNGDLQGADDPARVYLTCYEHFAAHGDPRARSILRLAASYLQERAAQISNAALRHAFLENIPSNPYLRRLTHTSPSASPQI